MEIWDAYDKNEVRTGEDLIRGEKIPKGRYHLVCDVLVQHVDGSYLVMQRDLEKESCPGKFEATAGGSALKGEDPKQCAIRELQEETGILATNLQRISYDVWEHTIYYGYLTITDCEKDSIVLQEGETISYRWLSKEEFLQFVQSDDYIPSQYQRLKPYLAGIEEVE